MIELCAGSARVTACARALGLSDSFGVDHVRQRNSGKVLLADLTTKVGKALVKNGLHLHRC